MYAHKLFHFAVHLKLIQYCNSAIPHSKIPQMHYWRLWSCDELLKTKLHWMQEGESRPEFKALHLEVVLLVVQMGKTLPAMWVTWVQSLGQGDPLEEGMATHSSILAWRVPWTEKLRHFACVSGISMESRRHDVTALNVEEESWRCSGSPVEESWKHSHPLGQKRSDSSGHPRPALSLQPSHCLEAAAVMPEAYCVSCPAKDKLTLFNER